MKINYWLFFVACVGTIIATHQPAIAQIFSTQSAEDLQSLFSLTSSTTWKDFTLPQTTNQFNQKRWVWTGMITLKSSQPVNLQELRLEWHGEKIARLQASLYQKKDTDHKLIPIQENLVCDGSWNTRKQYLTFFLDKKIVAVNKYYLFLTFPEQDSSKVKHGTFVIPDQNSIKLTYLP